MCKAPLVPNGAPIVNSLFRQRTAIENILRACVGLAPNSHIALEHRVSNAKNGEQILISYIKFMTSLNDRY